MPFVSMMRTSQGICTVTLNMPVDRRGRLCPLREFFEDEFGSPHTTQPAR